MRDGNEVRRRRRTLTEEVLFHLLQDEFLSVGRS